MIYKGRNRHVQRVAKKRILMILSDLGVLGKGQQIWLNTGFCEQSYQNAAMILCLCIIYGFFGAAGRVKAMQQRSESTKPKIFIIWPFTEKVY